MIEKSLISEVLSVSMSSGADFAELYAEDIKTNSISLMDSKVENISSGRNFGVGIRLYKGFNSVYVYSNDAGRNGLLKLAENAALAMGELKKMGNKGIDFNQNPFNNQNPIKISPNSVDIKKKISPLKELDKIARVFSNKITQVMPSITDVEKNVLVANTDGLYVIDKRIRTSLALGVVAGNGLENQTGFERKAGHIGFELIENTDLEKMAKEAADTAITMLDAPYSPAGKMPVIIESGNGGTIFHEACGHSLEATSVAIGLSEMSGKINEKIASDIVSAYDDGTIPNAYGSQTFDDEGIPTQNTLLIENGILKNYLIDRLNSRRMNMPVTGSARRESYRFAPTSRMRNTFIAAGESEPSDIIKDTEYGLYAKKIGGGSVSPATGDFNFAVREGYIIKNGKIDRPVRGASLIGKGSEVLKKIDRVGNNLNLAPGTCGSLSGWVPVTVGQPTIRVSELLVGGKEA